MAEIIGAAIGCVFCIAVAIVFIRGVIALWADSQG